MRSIAELKHRKKSVAETAQITRAMEIISVSKLNKLNALLDTNSLYFSKVRSTIKDIILHTDKEVRHPFLAPHSHSGYTPNELKYGKNPAYIVISADKGLAGDYNHKIIKKAEEEMSEVKGTLFVIGHTAAEYFTKEGYEPDLSFVNAGSKISLNTARKIEAVLSDLYENSDIDSIKIIYTDRQRSAVPEPTVIRLLPILVEDFDDVEKTENLHKYTIQYHPSAHEVLNVLVPQYILGMVFSALIQATVCENIERVRTMHSATLNADKLMAKLTLEYNRARQEMITTELAELSGTKLFDK